MLASSYRIPKRNTACFMHAEKFTQGSEIYSVLTERSGCEFVRQDYCASCWKTLGIEQNAKRIYWKARIEEPHVPPTSHAKLERALILLRSENLTDAEVFVLSLFLAHARVLSLRQEFQQDEETYQLYEILGQDEFVPIKMLNLAHEEIAKIQKLLAEKL